jgi:hypothetical protein
MLCFLRSMTASQGARSSVTSAATAAATAVRGRMLGVGQQTKKQHHSFALASLSRSSTSSSRSTTRSAPRLVNHVGVTSCTPPAGTTKRTFFGNSSYGHYRTHHHLPEPEEFVTPMETILMDCTAWFVAFALIYTPTTLHHHEDEADDDNNNNKSQSKEAHRERRRRQERNESRGTNNRQQQKDDSVDN